MIHQALIQQTRRCTPCGLSAHVPTIRHTPCSSVATSYRMAPVHCNAGHVGRYEAIVCGGGKFIGPHSSGIGCHAQACAGMLGDQNHRNRLTNMATPTPGRSMSISRGVAMAPRALEVRRPPCHPNRSPSRRATPRSIVQVYLAAGRTSPNQQSSGAGQVDDSGAPEFGTSPALPWRWERTLAGRGVPSPPQPHQAAKPQRCTRMARKGRVVA